MDTTTDQVGPSERTEAGSPTLDDRERRRQGRDQTLWSYLGLGLGVVVGLALTAKWVADRQYGFINVHEILLLNLIWAPALGLIAGNALGRPRSAARRWDWKRLHIGLGTLMAIVAYLAFLMAMGITARRWDASARHSWMQFQRSDGLAKQFRDDGLKQAALHEQKRATVEGLRSGKIPAGLLPVQRTFLQGLEDDPKVTPEFRQERRDLIQAGEEWVAALSARNVVVLREVAAYHAMLAAKYDRARWRPWLPVEPDPPAPVPSPAPDYVPPARRERHEP